MLSTMAGWVIGHTGTSGGGASLRGGEARRGWRRVGSELEHDGGLSWRALGAGGDGSRAGVQW